MLPALIGVAFGAPVCEETVGRERFRTWVIDAQSALDRGDLEATEDSLARLYDDLPCLHFAPEPRLWANAMIVQAVVNFAQDRDWESPLATALRIRPGIDRGVGRGHPIYDWPAPPDLETTPLPSGQTLYVDGREVDWLPPDEGWFLVQKSDGRYWETVIQRNSPLSTAWAESPVEQPPRIRYLLDLSVGGAGMFRAQNQLWTSDLGEPEGRYAAQTGQLPLYGPQLQTRVTFFSNVGLALNGSFFFGFAGGVRDGNLQAIMTPGTFVFGLGAGVSDVVRETSDAVIGEQENEPVVRIDRDGLRFWVGSAAWRTRSPIQTELTGTFGFRALRSWYATVDTRVVFDEDVVLGGHFRFGGRVMWRTAQYSAREDSTRNVSFDALTVSVNAGIVFGDLR